VVTEVFCRDFIEGAKPLPRPNVNDGECGRRKTLKKCALENESLKTKS
jgi:hypothetical protein